LGFTLKILYSIIFSVKIFSMSDLIQIGKAAPNFVTVKVLNNRIGTIRLSDYHRKKYVVLIFYPANFTSVSPTELIRLNELIT